MRIRTKRLCAAAASTALLLAWVGDAAAGCTRRVYNRSANLLVVSPDDGPSFTVLPGTSKPVRLSRRGRIGLAVSCPGHAGSTPQAPLAQSQFTYEAVLDRCYMEFGTQLYVSELGRGFFGTQGTKPFTLNNPKQGDIVLGPFEAGCPGLSRRG